MTAKQSGSGKNFSLSDFDILSERRLEVITKKDPEALDAFSDAPIIVADKSIRDRLNNKMTATFASKTSQEVHIYHSQDRFKRAPVEGMLQHHCWQVSSTISNDHMGMLPLVPGMRVVVTENAAMAAKVVNGSEGVLRNIKYEEDQNGERYAVCAYVHIPGSNLQVPGLEFEVVLILPTRSHFVYNSSKGKGRTKSYGPSFSISRLQLPLLPAYAFTEYKIQGRSLKHVIVDLQGCKSLQSAYVMLSRATSLSAIAILRWFVPGKIYKPLSQQFRDEFTRLQILEEHTTDRFEHRHDVPVDY